MPGLITKTPLWNFTKLPTPASRKEKNKDSGEKEREAELTEERFQDPVPSMVDSSSWLVPPLPVILFWAP
jgi:hypothetical protein